MACYWELGPKMECYWELGPKMAGYWELGPKMAGYWELGPKMAAVSRGWRPEEVHHPGVGGHREDQHPHRQDEVYN